MNKKNGKQNGRKTLVALVLTGVMTLSFMPTLALASSIEGPPSSGSESATSAQAGSGQSEMPGSSFVPPEDPAAQPPSQSSSSQPVSSSGSAASSSGPAVSSSGPASGPQSGIASQPAAPAAEYTVSFYSEAGVLLSEVPVAENEIVAADAVPAVPQEGFLGWYEQAVAQAIAAAREEYALAVQAYENALDTTPEGELLPEEPQPVDPAAFGAPVSLASPVVKNLALQMVLASAAPQPFAAARGRSVPGVGGATPASAFLFDASTQTIVGLAGDAPRDIVVPASLYGVAVLHIGDNAMAGKQLTSVTLPEGLLTIGSNALMNNPSIEVLVLPNSLVSIGDSAFEGCTGLKTLNLGTGVQTIGNYAFFYSDSYYDNFGTLENLTIPNSVISIGNNAFSGMSNLKTLDLGQGVQTIGSYAFSYCGKNTQTINLDIPDSVHTIGDFAFSGSRLKSLKLGKGVLALNRGVFSSASIETVDLGEHLQSIGTSAFAMCDKITNITIPASVHTIAGDAFANNTLNLKKLKKILIPSKATDEIAGAPWGNITATVYWKDVIDADPFVFNTVTKNIVGYIGGGGAVNIPVSISVEGAEVPVQGFSTGVFTGNESITSVTVPEGTTTIPDAAFAGCGALASVILPFSLTTIGENAFTMCKRLTRITLPSGLTTLGRGAFSGCYSLTSINLPNGITRLEEYVFFNCNGLTSITLPSSLKTIGSSALAYNNGLTDITIPDSVVDISNTAFFSSMNLKKILIPTKETDAILGAPWGGLRATIYWKDVVDISPFVYNTHTNNIVGYIGPGGDVDIPASLTLNGAELPVLGIGENAFAGIPTITSVTIAEGITSVGKSAFQSCTGLRSATLPNSVTKIEWGTFSGCTALVNVTLPENLASIGPSAFSDCSALAGISLPNSVTTIGEFAFSRCEKLNNITLPSGLTVLEDYVFQACTALTNITLPENLVRIDGGAFALCSSLAGITLPAGLTSIQTYTFRDCSALTNIQFPAGLTDIGGEAFANCTSLGQLNFPANLSYVASDAFKGSNSIPSILVARSEVGAPPSLTANRPWGAPQSTEVRYLGEYVAFSHTLSQVPGEYKKNINISASIGASYLINVVTLPNGKEVNALGQRWPSTGTYSYPVTQNGTYTFKGKDQKGLTVEYNVVANGIGEVNLTAANGVVSTADAPSLTEAEVLRLLGAVAKDELGADVPLSLASGHLARAQALTSPGASAAITVKAGPHAASGQTKQTTVTLTATGDYVVQFVDWDNSPLGAARAVAHGGDATPPPEPTRTGYDFAAWDKAYTNVQANLVVQATYTLKQYTLLVKNPGGSQNMSATVPDGTALTILNKDGGTLRTETVNGANLTVTLPALQGAGEAPTGQELDKWTVTKQTESQYTATPSFKAKQYTVTFTAGANGALTGGAPQTKHVPHGTAFSAVAKPATQPSANYKLENWTLESGAAVPAAITQNITVRANFTLETHTVTFTAGPNGTLEGGAPQTKEMPHGTAWDTVAKPGTQPQAGYALEKWTLDGGGQVPATITEDITVKAVFGRADFTITFTAGENGTLVGDAQQTTRAVKGMRWADVAKPGTLGKPGYAFDIWTLADGGAMPATVQSDLAVLANFTGETYTVTFDGNGADVQALPPTMRVTFPQNTLGALPKPPTRAGHLFSGWNLQADGRGPVFDRSTPITANITVYAQWTVQHYTLSFHLNGGESVQIPSQTVPAGELAKAVTDPTRTGFTFTGWATRLTEGETWNFGTSRMPAENLTLYAQWSENAAPPPNSQAPAPPPNSQGPANQGGAGAAVSSSSSAAALAAPEEDDSSSTSAENATAGVTGGAAATGTGTGPASSGSGGQQAEPGATTQEELLQKQSGNVFTDIVDGLVPLGSLNIPGVWSLLSLVLAVLGLFSSLLCVCMAILRRRQKRGEYQEQNLWLNEKTRRLVRLLAILAGVGMGVLFLLLNNMANPVVWVNGSTPIFIVLFLAQCFAGFLTVLKARRTVKKGLPSS